MNPNHQNNQIAEFIQRQNIILASIAELIGFNIKAEHLSTDKVNVILESMNEALDLSHETSWSCGNNYCTICGDR